jgi:replicative DNA helicase
MQLTEKEIADLKKLIRDRVDNYPDLESMVKAGRLTYKSGWYEAANKEAYDAIIQYATSIRVSKDGKAQVKVSQASKRLKALAKKL